MQNSSVKSYKKDFTRFIYELQDMLCNQVETIDERSEFREDIWERTGGGGGKTRVLEDGQVIEKAGINTSEVFGELPTAMQSYLNTQCNYFFACGISLVIHPRSPMIPTVHANFRYFELYKEDRTIQDLWFGGGTDLTPYYLFEEDAVHFHKVLKDACEKFGSGLYEKYKQQCDYYFYNTHRKEARGIGGLFFDRLNEKVSNTNQFWSKFTQQVGYSFASAYFPIVEKRKSMPYTASQKEWQELRRGRYVEFNLLHDKGTLFGLKTNGRIESILMSLPPVVRWEYNPQIEANSQEQKLIDVLENPINWLDK